MPYRSSSGSSTRVGSISDPQPGGLTSYVEGLQLLEKAPFILDKQAYQSFADQGMSALRVHELVRLLKLAGRVTVVDTMAGRKIERR